MAFPRRQSGLGALRALRSWSYYPWGALGFCGCGFVLVSVYRESAARLGFRFRQTTKEGETSLVVQSRIGKGL